jgi:DNA-binding MurR/RpiR family transcriptional regulator
MSKLYNSKDWLYNRYIVKRMNIVEIAKEAGCSHMTIQRALEKFGLIKGRK